MEAERIALIPRCPECCALWLPADKERWQQAWLTDDEPPELVLLPGVSPSGSSATTEKPLTKQPNPFPEFIGHEVPFTMPPEGDTAEFEVGPDSLERHRLVDFRVRDVETGEKWVSSDADGRFEYEDPKDSGRWVSVPSEGIDSDAFDTRVRVRLPPSNRARSLFFRPEALGEANALRPGRAASEQPGASHDPAHAHATPRVRARLVALSATTRSVRAASPRRSPARAERQAATIAASSIVAPSHSFEVAQQPSCGHAWVPAWILLRYQHRQLERVFEAERRQLLRRRLGDEQIPMLECAAEDGEQVPG